MWKTKGERIAEASEFLRGIGKMGVAFFEAHSDAGKFLDEDKYGMVFSEDARRHLRTLHFAAQLAYLALKAISETAVDPLATVEDHNPTEE